MPILFARHTADCEPQGAGGDHERSVGAREDLAKGLDGATVSVGCLLEAAGESDVVFEREVNDPVRAGGSGA
jgi:hypothetical protein